MSAGPGSFDQSAYRPTSVNSLISPNPVEPHAVPQKHPLHNTATNAPNQGLLRVLLDPTFSNVGLGHNGAPAPDRPVKRRKSGDVRHSDLDLPKLPVRHGSQRLRIPPTLSGLHQPPPDAGLLPSISVKKPPRVAVLEPPETADNGHHKDGAKASPTTGPSSAVVNDVVTGPSKASIAKSKRNKWTEEETACLLKGVARFGIGNWTKILQCSDYHFVRRTALDLKDRFRVCCPDDYKTARQTKSATFNKEVKSRPHATEEVRRGRKPEKKSSSQLRELGIDEAFAMTKRRKRTAYSAAEDEALLQGFKKHGISWSDIQQDKNLGLVRRTATDLRDRFRTRYPNEYGKAGLAPRPDVFPKPAQRDPKKSEVRDESSAADANDERRPTPPQRTRSKTFPTPMCTHHEKENNNEPVMAEPEKALPTSLLPSDDVFFGLDLDMDSNETERITLDRKILDWPSDLARSSANGTAGTSGDPFAALNLPKPTSSTNSGPGPGANSSTSAQLPSLAAITSGSIMDDMRDQLELPSLMAGFGTFENESADARTNANLMSLDELLS